MLPGSRDGQFPSRASHELTFAPVASWRVLWPSPSRRAGGRHVGVISAAVRLVGQSVMSMTKKPATWRQRMAEAREESLIEGGEGKRRCHP